MFAVIYKWLMSFWAKTSLCMIIAMEANNNFKCYISQAGVLWGLNSWKERHISPVPPVIPRDTLDQNKSCFYITVREIYCYWDAVGWIRDPFLLATRSRGDKSQSEGHSHVSVPLVSFAVKLSSQEPLGKLKWAGCCSVPRQRKEKA